MKRLILLPFLFLTNSLVPAKAYPCSCKISGDGSPRSTMRHAKAVFVGEVLELTEATKEQTENGFGCAVARMKVERFWKGVKSSEIIVSTEIGRVCGPGLEVGQKYLVYAFGRSLSLICTPTRKLEYAEKDLKALGPGKEVKPSMRTLPTFRERVSFGTSVIPISRDNRARGLLGTRAACVSATGAAACVAPSLRSGGCARA